MDIYLHIGALWAVFCLGHEVGKRPEATFFRLFAVGVLNALLWPITLVLALFL